MAIESRFATVKGMVDSWWSEHGRTWPIETALREPRVIEDKEHARIRARAWLEDDTRAWERFREEQEAHIENLKKDLKATCDQHDQARIMKAAQLKIRRAEVEFALHYWSALVAAEEAKEATPQWVIRYLLDCARQILQIRTPRDRRPGAVYEALLLREPRAGRRPNAYAHSQFVRVEERDISLTLAMELWHEQYSMSHPDARKVVADRYSVSCSKVDVAWRKWGPLIATEPMRRRHAKLKSCSPTKEWRGSVKNPTRLKL